MPLKQPGPNLVDAAIATIDSSMVIDGSTLTGLPFALAGVRQDAVEPGDEVFKVGRTTQHTRGRVTAIEMDDVVVEYERGEMSFNRQIEIEGVDDRAFSAGGDSGSFVVDAQGAVFGLLFAGGDIGGTNGRGLTYVNDIHSVMDHLDLEWRPQ